MSTPGKTARVFVIAVLIGALIVIVAIPIVLLVEVVLFGPIPHDFSFF